jgi:ABC-type multidrug transport system fused ATPase/permease subunit
MGYFSSILSYGKASELKWTIFAIMFLLTITFILEAIGIPLLIPVFETLLGKTSKENEILLKINEYASNFDISIDINILVILIISTIVVSTLLKYINSILMLNMRRRVIIQFRGKLIESYFRTNWMAALNERSGEVINLFVEKGPLSGDLYFHIIQGFTAFFYGLLYIGIAVYLSLEITLILTALFLVLTFVNKYFADKARMQSKENLKYSNLLAANMYDQFRAIKFIFSARLQEKILSNTRTTNHMSIKYDYNSRVLLSAAQHFNQLFYVIIIVSTIAFSQYLNIYIINIIIILYVIRQLYPQVQAILKAYQVWVVNKPQLEAVINKIENYSTHEFVDSSIILDGIERIQFKDVTFQYENNKPLFKNLSFTIEKNNTTAIIGISGSGKTTIVDLLIGLLKPKDGHILFGSTSLLEINKNKLSEKISYVSQDSILFNGTILENIVMRKQNASKKEIEDVLEMVALSSLIEDLPDGLYTEVGENGVKLSGGQKQRIALARALIVSPNLLIMDEATSALDVESETAIRKSIEKLHGSITIVLVAHRLSTIKSADIIYVMEHGTILESGTYNSLVKEKGRLYLLDQLS